MLKYLPDAFFMWKSVYHTVITITGHIYRIKFLLKDMYVMGYNKSVFAH